MKVCYFMLDSQFLMSSYSFSLCRYHFGSFITSSSSNSSVVIKNGGFRNSSTGSIGIFISIFSPSFILSFKPASRKQKSLKYTNSYESQNPWRKEIYFIVQTVVWRGRNWFPRDANAKNMMLRRTWDPLYFLLMALEANMRSTLHPPITGDWSFLCFS